MGAAHHACIYLYTVTYGSLCRDYYMGHLIQTCLSVLSHADMHAHSFPTSTLQVPCARSSASRCSPALASCTLMWTHAGKCS